MVMKIYCSGSIQKGAADVKKLCWTDAERSALALGAAPLQVRFLNPDDPARDLNDTEVLFGRDMYQVQAADAVVVDGRERRGIGIGIEMVVSRLVGSLLVVVVPPNTYYRMENVAYRGGTVATYVHPHVAMLADAVVDDFRGAGQWLLEAKTRRIRGKGKDVIEYAIMAYKERLLDWDEPMKRVLLETHE